MTIDDYKSALIADRLLYDSREERRVALLKCQPSLRKIEKAVLALGGEEVVFRAEPTTFLEALVARGALLDLPAKKVKGRPSDCHVNAVRRAFGERKGETYFTGYALSEDGLWRQHSWTADGRRIYETTEKRIKYWGVSLSEADFFIEVRSWEGL